MSRERDLLAEYDFIIVGGGTAGLTVASRLSEDPRLSVLIVEYGRAEDDASILIPQHHNSYSTDAVQSDPSIRQLFHHFDHAPVRRLNNLVLPMNTGSTVGGGSVINGMLFNRGSRADYDAWERLGNNGWGWEDLKPYFLKSSTFTPPDKPLQEQLGYTWRQEAWGTDGPVQGSFPPFAWPQQHLFPQAFSEVNRDISFLKEANDGTGIGVAWVPSTLTPDTRQRSSAKTAYYDSVAGRKNLYLLTETRVRKIIFSEKTACGIEVELRKHDRKVDRRFLARKEIIIAAGPVFSPYLLQRSGVGPKALLGEAGIPLLHELPGVGLNLQDTPMVKWVWHMQNLVGPDWTDYVYKKAIYDEARREYDEKRSGPLTVCFGSLIASLALQQIDPNWATIVRKMEAEDHLKYLPSPYDETSKRGYAAQVGQTIEQIRSGQSAVYEYPYNGWSSTCINLLQKPFSRGTVALSTSNPDAGPVVDYNTLADPTDGLLIHSIVKFTRELYKTKTLTREFNPKEIYPGTESMDQESVIEALIDRNGLWPSCGHQAGTCAMMPLEYGGVVDNELRVHGLKGLSVVDSSAIPMLPASRLVHTVYAVAEKGADLIKARHAI